MPPGETKALAGSKTREWIFGIRYVFQTKVRLGQVQMTIKTGGHCVQLCSNMPYLLGLFIDFWVPERTSPTHVEFDWQSNLRSFDCQSKNQTPFVIYHANLRIGVVPKFTQRIPSMTCFSRTFTLCILAVSVAVLSTNSGVADNWPTWMAVSYTHLTLPTICSV